MSVLGMRKLSPVRDKDKYHQVIYKEIKALLDKELFTPVMEIALEEKVENAPLGQLLRALRRGEISYARDYFTGKFNAHLGFELRHIGAKWDKGRRAYFLQESQVPQEVKIAIARGRADVQDKINKIKDKLDTLQIDGTIPTVNFNRQVEGILLDMDGQFRTTVPKDIGLPMTTTEMQKRAIREGYTENLNLYIQKTTKESAQRLRGKILKHVEQGGRAADLVPLIEAQQGVSRRHALFLAKQETSILVSTYRDARYREAGIDEYIWSTSHDSRVRPDHRKLNGKKFKFNEPPVENLSTGNRANPGYSYGCRCIAIPVI